MVENAAGGLFLERGARPRFSFYEDYFSVTLESSFKAS